MKPVAVQSSVLKPPIVAPAFLPGLLLLGVRFPESQSPHASPCKCCFAGTGCGLQLDFPNRHEAACMKLECGTPLGGCLPPIRLTNIKLPWEPVARVLGCLLRYIIYYLLYIIYYILYIIYYILYIIYYILYIIYYILYMILYIILYIPWELGIDIGSQRQAPDLPSSQMSLWKESEPLMSLMVALPIYLHTSVDVGLHRTRRATNSSLLPAGA